MAFHIFNLTPGKGSKSPCSLLISLSISSLEVNALFPLLAFNSASLIGPKSFNVIDVITINPRINIL